MPPAGVEPRELRIVAPAVSGEAPAPSDTEPTPPAGPPLATGPGADLAAAITRLQETLASLPGPEREVHLLYEDEDQSFVVEVRDKQSGDLISRFPPEKLLNHGTRPADLLGTVIDRRS